jgi:hypothetical protein
MGVLRPHLALTVIDVERSVLFYEALAGVVAFDEMDTTCCYARQDKIWLRDPDGTPWEIFATHQDTTEAGEGGLAMAQAAARSCCAEVTGCCAA